MFTLNRRTVAGLAAFAALAGAAAPQAAAPQAAEAAAYCDNWALPSQLDIRQGNGWRVIAYSPKKFKYTAVAQDARGTIRMRGTVRLTRFDTSGSRPQVRFIATWNTGGVGTYTGRIDADGLMTGKTADKFGRNATTWHNADTLDCNG